MVIKIINNFNFDLIYTSRLTILVGKTAVLAVIPIKTPNFKFVLYASIKSLYSSESVFILDIILVKG
jgi:hypothetical protein